MTAAAHLPFAIAEAERTVPAMLQLQAGRFAERPQFSARGDGWSFGGAPEVAARMAGALLGSGLNAGDRVAVLSSNRAELLRILLGCGWAGIVAVPINIASKARQVRYYLENSGARLLIAERHLFDGLGDGALDGLPLQAIWMLGDAAAGTEPFRSDGPVVAARAVAPGDDFAILYTSGTTGMPKGVICPHAQFYWWGVYTSRFLDIERGDRLVTMLPLFHTNAINTFFQALVTGACQIVEPRFSASSFWAGMAATGATVTYLLGAMIPILLAQPPSAAERRHNVRVALGPGVPAHLHDVFLERTGVKLVDGFGSTETNFVIGDRADDRVAGRIGRLSPGVDARVVDEQGIDVAAGASGELLLRAEDPLAFAKGYFGMPEKTAQSQHAGWFHTGDRVIRFADGHFAFVDRLKDSIRRRGENISSLEVEQVLAAHPAVASCAVFPVPSPLAEDEVMATVVLKAAAVCPPAVLAAYCAEHLPRFAVPRYIDVVDAMPVTENGKIRKAALRERGVGVTTWDREQTTKN